MNISRPAGNGNVDVCIVITNQNQGTLLERCIRSCVSQTFPGRFHEVLVADAGSNDFSREVIRAYGNRVLPVLLDPPGTPEEAALAALKRADGRYVVHVRAQDYISDYMILFQAIWLYQNHEYDGVGVDYWLVEPDSDSKVQRVSGQERPHSYGTMYRKEILVREGLYEPTCRQWEIEKLQAELAKKYRIGHIPIPFYRYQLDKKAEVPA